MLCKFFRLSKCLYPNKNQYLGHHRCTRILVNFQRSKNTCVLLQAKLYKLCRTPMLHFLPNPKTMWIKDLKAIIVGSKNMIVNARRSVLKLKNFSKCKYLSLKEQRLLIPNNQKQKRVIECTRSRQKDAWFSR